jgi:hypothetical protein
MLALSKHLDHYRGLSSLIWQGITVSLLESSMIAICYFLTLYFVNELHFNIAYDVSLWCWHYPGLSY